MKYSAVILSGGDSKRFGEDKGLYKILRKPLISYIIETVKPIVNEVIIVTNNDKKERYSTSFPKIKIFSDDYEIKAPISGALTGFKNAVGDYSLLLTCDTPLISQKIITLFMNLAPRYDAIIPRWPNGFIEPLQSIYETRKAFNACLKSIEECNYRLTYMISKIGNVNYLPTSIIKELDPKLLTFMNINTRRDLREIKELLKIKLSSREQEIL